MTLAELLTECQRTRKGKRVRVFAGSTTLFNGNPSVMSMDDWVKLHPYFKFKVRNKGVVNDTFIIVL